MENGDPDAVLEAALERVVDRASFGAFLLALADHKKAEDALHELKTSDPYSAGALGWEHLSIASYLQASAAWADATSGSWAPDNPWRACATILAAGLSYE
ncbi:MAG: hypothetical protein AAF366_18170 [Pseudomonadota bacterium]